MAVTGMTYILTLSLISVLLLSHLCNAQATSTTKPTTMTAATTKMSTPSSASTGSTAASSTSNMPPKTTTSKASGYVTFSASLLIGASFLALKMQH